MEKYKVGDKVRIVEERTYSMPSHGSMDKYLGKVMTIRSTDESGDYKMLEDNGHWSWNDNMISGLVNDKVFVHPDFEKWYKEIEDNWNRSAKEFAIICINQMGFGHGLENSEREKVTGLYRELSLELQANKEKYTRAILDDSWVSRKQKLYYVKFPGFDADEGYLNFDKSNGEYTVDEPSESSYFKTKFTEAEIKAIDERYWAFAVEVRAED